VDILNAFSLKFFVGSSIPERMDWRMELGPNFTVLFKKVILQ
jgi:hypothetical protein